MEEIAQVYARSLFQVAQEQGKLDVVREELGQVSETLEPNHDMRLFFFSPYFSTEEKREGLRSTIQGADPVTMNLLDVLVENHRLPVVPRIRREYERLWRDANDLLPVTVTSAVELDDAVVARIGEEIGRQTGRKVELTRTVDPSIVGGVVIKVGDKLVDGSVKTRLRRLRRELEGVR